MGENIILFVMGNVLIKNDNGRVAIPSENLYKHEKAGGGFPGIQANEAPVKYLIQAGKNSGKPVTGMVYLCSTECLIPNIPSKLAQKVTPGFTPDTETITSEDFFLARIKSYCEQNGCILPSPKPIPFNPARPADSLDDLVSVLGTGAHISIDITSGPRDAAILMTLAAQVIKMGAKGTTVGNILYTNFDKKTIFKQNNSFDLIDLVNAINSFTDYGRANQLKTFFHENQHIKEPTQQLCASIEEFSDSLALCHLDDIEEKILHVQQCLDKTESELGLFKNRFKLYTNAIEQIDIASPIRSASFENSIEEIKGLHPNISFEELDREELFSTLTQLRDDVMMIRSELLFLSLIPTIREKFIRTTTNRSELIRETIKWCIDRQMVQQALGIYREHVPQCVVDAGFLSPRAQKVKPEVWLKALSNVACTEAIEHINIEEIDRDINKYFENKGLVLIDGVDRTELREAFLLKQPSKYARRDHLIIDADRNNQLSVILMWFRYVWLVRNFTMHVSEPTDQFLSYIATYKDVYGEKRYPDHYALSDIQHDLELALTSFESSSGNLYNESTWMEIFNQLTQHARTVTTDEFNQLVNNLRSKTTPEQPYVFENDFAGIPGIRPMKLASAISAISSDFESVICIRIMSTRSNNSRREKIARNEGNLPKYWKIPWNELMDKLIAFSLKVNRDYVVWDEFIETNSLPAKAKFGLGNAPKTKLFQKLAKEYPNDFSIAPCLKCINSTTIPNQIETFMPPQESHEKSLDQPKKNKKKNKPSKGKSSKTDFSRRLSSDLSSRLDQETLKKLDAFK